MMSNTTAQPVRVKVLYRCGKCMLIFESQQELKNHDCYQFVRKTFSCSDCPATFSHVCKIKIKSGDGALSKNCVSEHSVLLNEVQQSTLKSCEDVNSQSAKNQDQPLINTSQAQSANYGELSVNTSQPPVVQNQPSITPEQLIINQDQPLINTSQEQSANQSELSVNKSQTRVIQNELTITPEQLIIIQGQPFIIQGQLPVNPGQQSVIIQGQPSEVQIQLPVNHQSHELINQGESLIKQGQELINRGQAVVNQGQVPLNEVTTVSSEAQPPSDHDYIRPQENCSFNSTEKVSKTELKCSKCEKQFKTESKYTRHTAQCRGLFNRHKCTVCQERFTFQCELEVHIQVHGLKMNLICQFCDEIFHTSYELRCHKKTHGPTEKCDICDELFASRKDVRLHKLVVHSIKHPSLIEKEFKCEKCPKSFSTKGNLSAHIRYDHEGAPKQFECKICKMRFSVESKLRIHGECHGIKQNLKCHLCAEIFPNMNAIKRHRQIKHSERPPPRQIENIECPPSRQIENIIEPPPRPKCEFCDERFSTVRATKEHQFYKHSVKSLQCPDCNLMFGYKTNLDRHRVNHTGDKTRNKCEFCDRSYHFKSDLKKHSVVHTKEKKYSCNICNKTFTQISGVHLHKRSVHYNVYPYLCQYCPKRFKLKMYLDSHLNVHRTTEERRKYFCDNCGKMYLNASGLAWHKKKLLCRKKKE